MDTGVVVCGLFSMFDGIVKFIRRINCGNVLGVVLPMGTGKSTVCSNFNVDEKTILLDLEEAVRLSLDNETLKKLDDLKARNEMTSYNSMFYIACRKYVKEQRKAFQHKRYILFSSDKKLLKYCGAKTIHVFSPSDNFFNKIKANMEKEISELASKNRMEILLEQGTKNLNIFNNFDELANILGRILELKHKL